MLITTDITKRLGIIEKVPNSRIKEYNFNYKKDSIKAENCMLKNTINDLVRYNRSSYGEGFSQKVKTFASKVWKGLLKIVTVVREFITSVINKFKNKDRLIGKLAKSLMDTSRKIDTSNQSTEVNILGDWFKYMLEQVEIMKLDGIELDDIPRPIMELFQSIVENDGKIQVYAIDEAGRFPNGKPYYKRERELKNAATLLVEECDEKIEAIENDTLQNTLDKYKAIAKNYDSVVHGDKAETLYLKDFKEKLYQSSKDLQKIYTGIIYVDFSIKNLNEMLFYIEKWAKRRIENKDIIGDDEYDKRITEFANRCQNFTSKQLSKVSEVTKVTNTLTNQCINYANNLLKVAKPYIKKKEKKSNEKSK